MKLKFYIILLLVFTNIFPGIFSMETDLVGNINEQEYVLADFFNMTETTPDLPEYIKDPICAFINVLEPGFESEEELLAAFDSFTSNSQFKKITEKYVQEKSAEILELNYKKLKLYIVGEILNSHLKKYQTKFQTKSYLPYVAYNFKAYNWSKNKIQSDPEYLKYLNSLFRRKLLKPKNISNPDHFGIAREFLNLGAGAAPYLKFAIEEYDYNFFDILFKFSTDLSLEELGELLLSGMKQFDYYNVRYELKNNLISIMELILNKLPNNISKDFFENASKLVEEKLSRAEAWHKKVQEQVIKDNLSWGELNWFCRGPRNLSTGLYDTKAFLKKLIELLKSRQA